MTEAALQTSTLQNKSHHLKELTNLLCYCTGFEQRKTKGTRIHIPNHVHYWPWTCEQE